MAYQYDFKFIRIQESQTGIAYAAYLGNTYVAMGKIANPQSGRPEYGGLCLTEEGHFLAPMPALTESFLNFLHEDGFPQIWMETADKEMGEALGFTMVDSIYSGEAPLFLFVHQKTEG